MNSIGSFTGLASGVDWADLVDQIMTLETQRKITPLTTRVSAYQARREKWSAYEGLLSKLNTAAAGLRDRSAFGVLKTAASTSPVDGKTLISASASSAAAAGSYAVEVISLAKAEKVSGSALASTSTALGVGGEFYVNGRAVEIESTDSLANVRDKVNAVNSGSTASGVTATILSTSSTSHRLVLTADNTGARGIELVDGSNDTLQYLGLVSATTSRNTAPGDSSKAQSQRFSSSTTALAAMLGVTAPPAVTTITIDGQKVSVDLQNDTLLSIMNRIATAGGTSELTEEVVGGTTHQRLTVDGEVTADATASDPAASQQIVELLGFVKQNSASTITDGQDAVFRIDGFKMSRRTNTVSDAIAGVTLNLLVANGSQRTSSVTGAGLSITTDPRSIDAGTYAIALQTTTDVHRTVETDSGDLMVASDPGVADGTYAVALTHSVTRSTSKSNPDLSVLAAPGTASAGTYSVVISSLASVATTTGAGFDDSYNKAGGTETITVTDSLGLGGTVSLGDNMTTNDIVSALNTEFTGSGAGLLASNVGGQLRITATGTASSASTITVSSNSANVATNLGLADGVYSGADIAGTIGGIAATGSGNVLTGASGAVNGLQVQYSAASTGAVGTVTITDTAAVTGGTIGGVAATWNAVTETLTADAGTGLDGLAVTFTGTPTTGTVGNVIVDTVVEEYITGVTIDGQTAEWDEASNTITGTAGGDFDGLVLTYTGAATSGTVGTLTIEGDIGVTLDVARDLDATVTQMTALAAAYNEVVDFYNSQRGSASAPLYANGTLRSMQRSLTESLLTTVEGLPSGSAYTRGTLAGVSLTSTGLLEVDAETLKSALQTNLSDVKALFGTGGTATNGQVSFSSSTSESTPGTYAVSITAAATRASHLGSVWGGNYTASDGVSDTLTITDSYTGGSVDFIATEGMTLSEAVTELTELFENEGLALTAVAEGGALRIRSIHYGTGVTFDLSGAEAPTRLGLTAGAYAGTDVAGTIGGFAATGAGQVLTGDDGETTEGLAITYTGTDTGSKGTVSFVLGITGYLERVIAPIISTGDGTIPLQLEAIDSSLTSLEGRVTDAETRLEIRRATLEAQFLRMESAIAMLNSQGSWLSSQISSLQGNSTS